MARIYHPECKIKLIKLIKRSEIAEGVPLESSRYQAYVFNLTPLLGESGTVQISKSVRESAGAFSIQIPDKADGTITESIYGLVEPMDMVEIRMAHDPFEYPDGIPIVMRGLITTISRGETMQDDKPLRVVTITGHDYGKVMQILQIFYLNISIVGENIISELKFFHKYFENGSPKLMSAEEFASGMLKNVINPYLNRLTAVTEKAVRAFSLEISIDGYVSPQTISSFEDISVDGMMRKIFDVGAFNEMFIEDRETGIVLVIRPTPFKNVKKKFIQGSAVLNTIGSDEIVSVNVSRTDANVANYYWVVNYRWAFMQNEDAKAQASILNPDSFVKFQVQNASLAHYGIRKMEVESVLGPPDYANADSAKKEQIPGETTSLAYWLDRRRDLLAEMNIDNVVFESGTMVVMGNEKIKPGTYVRVLRGPKQEHALEAYVYQVEHVFRPFTSMQTILSFDRGTGFIDRARKKVPPYLSEIEAQGVRGA